LQGRTPLRDVTSDEAVMITPHGGLSKASDGIIVIS
jgi:hypothetical protein